MKVHDTKQEAIAAIKQYASIMKEISEATGADFIAESLDDTGMEYYVEAVYRDTDNKHHTVRIHAQYLDL